MSRRFDFERLANELKASGLKGCSPTNLPPEIQQTVSVESLPTSTGIASVLSSAMGDRFSLGWSHYVTLLTIGHAEERAFYEIEAAQNQWSVRELKRQIASSLYERLALSRDKDEVRRLSREGQVVEKASDLVKDPLFGRPFGIGPTPSDQFETGRSA